MSVAGHALKKLQVPVCGILDEFSIPLARMVAKTSYLPNPATIKAMASAVFPTIRGKDSKNRVAPILKDQMLVGMSDDNTTPRWALLWSHGISGVSKQYSPGWTFAHVWPSRDDIDAYTHLANLAMIPECFASLTDKQGPLTHYLRWHAWNVYGWKPSGEMEPQKPVGYEEIVWQYFPAIENPKAFVDCTLQKLNCKRSKILKPLMLK